MSANDPTENDAAAALEIPTYREESAEMECRKMGSDKVYNIQLTQSEAGWSVTAQYGPRNGTLTPTNPIKDASYDDAKKIFDSTVKAKLKGKDGKNYSYVGGPPATGTPWDEQMATAKTAVDGIYARADAEVNRLRSSGWTQPDFANALKEELQTPIAPKLTSSRELVGVNPAPVRSTDWERHLDGHQITGDHKATCQFCFDLHKNPAPATVAPKLTNSRGPVSADVVFAPELLTRVTKAEAVKFASDPRYFFQTKQDGDRLTVRVETWPNGVVNIYGYNKSGQVVHLDAQLWNAVSRLCIAASIDRLLMDGEWEADGFHAWELLELHITNPAWVGEGDLRELPYYQRLDMLEAILGDLLPELATILHLTYTARDTAAKLALLDNLKLEGVAVKLRTAPFRPGRNGQHKKYKHEQTASFIVGPKFGAKANDGHRSVALYIFDATAKSTSAWQLVDCGIPAVMPHTLRFVSTVKVADKYDVPPIGSVIEVRYLYAYPGGGIAQPAYFGKVRTDVPHRDCSTAQLKFKNGDADESEG